MKFIVLAGVLLFFAVAQSQNETATMEACAMIERDALLGCFRSHVDLNHDERITIDEIPNTTMPFFFMECDVNHNDALDIGDWIHPMACCLERSCIVQVCAKCFYYFNWTGI